MLCPSSSAYRGGLYYVVWKHDGEDSTYGIGPTIWVCCWEVIRGSDGRGELNWWEKFELLGDVGTMLGVGYTKGLTKVISKIC